MELWSQFKIGKTTTNRTLIAISLLAACSNAETPEIFQLMKTQYRDLKIADSTYFLRDFGWSNNTITIFGKNYRELKCSKGAYFFMGGYCRMQDENFLLLPFDYKDADHAKEDTLFSFSAPDQSSWNIRFDYDKKMSAGDSVVLTGKIFLQNDTLFKYTLYPYYLFPDSGNKCFEGHQFDVEVSKTNAFIKIWTKQGNGDTLYETVLFPEEKFINRMGKKLSL